MTFKNFLTSIFAALCVMPAVADVANAPNIVKVPAGQTIYISSMSDNGQWGISEKASTVEESIVPSGGLLINLNTMEMTDISDAVGFSGVADVTDDGSIVVGEQLSMPAYWTASTKTWTRLPLPAGCTSGRLGTVTPDGHYAVGYANPGGEIYQAVPVMYDLTTNSVVELPNLPQYDMNHFKSDFHRFTGISADGRYVIGEMSYIYAMPISMFYYVYDRVTGKYNVIGFTESLISSWRPDVPNVAFIESASMSPNGHWITGSAYMFKDVAGSEFGNEYSVAYRYNVLTDEFEIFDGDADSDIVGGSITNDGLIYAYGPAVNPARSTYVRHGNYYYSLSEILRQAYGINFSETSGLELTGLPCAVSADGKTLLLLYYIDESYVIKFNEPIENVLDKIDLLANYTVDPVSNSVMTAISTVSIRFDRNVTALGNPASIELRDEKGEVVKHPAGGGFTSNKQSVNIGFRTTEIPEGKTYSVYIPEGMISIEGDAKVTNKPIEIFYKGRGNASVKMAAAYPADGASIAALDASANPMILTFNANLKLTNASTTASLYREGENDPFCSLYCAVSGNMLNLYPLAAQNLFKDTNYKVVIPAGLVTDLSGNGANEEIVLHYSGTYVRQISSDDIYLFHDECDSYDQFMFYEGDHLTPSAVPAGWGFTADASPWYLTRESDTSTDMALASHSMYNPAGKSDDWLVIPQLFIPDENCYLAFQSQSYLNNKRDRLKVIVFESDDVYNTLNSTIVDKLRTGDVVYNELQSPGTSQENLSDDWRDNLVKLDKYAGKNIYIAFLNENNDQSAVFIDNVQVVHDMKYLTSFTHPDRAVNQQSMPIRGVITVQSEISTYSQVSMSLKDGDSKLVDSINETGLNLKKGDTYTFAFSTPLSLASGMENKFSVEIALNEDKTIVNSTVRNLVFEPVKRVVVEEYSGADCPNCPQGFVAMDNLEELFPGRILPVVLRTYGGDTDLAVGLQDYNNFLGLAAVGAPSGRLNRGGATFPMIYSGGDYLFSGAGIPNSVTGKDEECWLDVARQELNSPADADVHIQSAVQSDGSRINLNITVKSALTLNRQSLNLFAVVVEDGVETYQENGFRSVNSTNLGDWGANGIYGGIQFVYPFILNHCARAVGGVTFNGTGGLIPSDLTAGESYSAQMSVDLPQSIKNINNCHVIVMLIDAGTGKVVNANISPVNGESSGVSDIMSDADESSIVINTEGSVVRVSDLNDGEISAAVYDISGRKVAGGMASGSIEFDLTGNSGVLFVNAVTSNARKTVKIIVR